MNNFQLVSDFDSKYCSSKVRTEKKKSKRERNERKEQRSFQQSFVTQQYCVYYENFYELSRARRMSWSHLRGAVFAVNFFFNKETFLPASCLFWWRFSFQSGYNGLFPFCYSQVSLNVGQFVLWLFEQELASFFLFCQVMYKNDILSWRNE